MNFAYIVPRVIRHFMPEKLADWMKKRKLIIKAGIETSDPQAAAMRYLDYFSNEGISLKGKTVMIFGYGGNITTACELLKMGAARIILCEREDLPFPVFDENLLKEYPDYFITDKEGKHLNSTSIQIIHKDIRAVAEDTGAEKADLVISSSVFEHLDDPDSITGALYKLTKSGGVHFHFVDLRDHYFKYPFEMLTFSPSVWKKWLNPTSNLNRFRIPQYDSIFHKYFSTVKISITESNIDSFQKTKPRIQGEFLSGNDEIDSATRIIVEVKI
ncbi:MAG: methyltransferase domain-containing protein [Anaerolineaceae bacterium]